jgi:hypothetical protein
MKATVHVLIPFDLGLELDFKGKDAKEIVKDVSHRPTAPLTFQGRIFRDATVTAQIYKFGVGMLQLSFEASGDMTLFNALSCRTEALAVGKIGIGAWARTLVDGLLDRAKEFATYRYERRLSEIDVFPVFVLEKGVVDSAEAFVRRHKKALYGIVAGEANYDALSDFVLDNERLVNFGYYENEVVLIKRFGAVVSAEESRVILRMIRLAYALYWSLRAYNFFLDEEVDNAQALLQNLPPYYRFWEMPQRYQRFSREAMGFGMDKLAIVDSIHNVSANVPGIDADWHLRTLYKNVEREFDIDELSKTVEVKLERIEESYNSARDFLSTNFFIVVEILLILSLGWMVLDTTLLFTIANK